MHTQIKKLKRERSCHRYRLWNAERALRSFFGALCLDSNSWKELAWHRGKEFAIRDSPKRLIGVGDTLWLVWAKGCAVERCVAEWHLQSLAIVAFNDGWQMGTVYFGGGHQAAFATTLIGSRFGTKYPTVLAKVYYTHPHTVLKL